MKLLSVILVLLMACEPEPLGARVLGRMGDTVSDEQCSLGSIGPRLLVTARHCAKYLDRPGFFIEVYAQDPVQMVMAYDVGYDEDPPMVLVLDRELVVWDEPGFAPGPGTVSTYVSAQLVLHRCTTAILGPWTAQVRCSPRSVHGDSGSAIVGPDGKVWGVVSRGEVGTNKTYISIIKGGWR